MDIKVRYFLRDEWEFWLDYEVKVKKCWDEQKIELSTQYNIEYGEEGSISTAVIQISYEYCQTENRYNSLLDGIEQIRKENQALHDKLVEEDLDRMDREMEKFLDDMKNGTYRPDPKLLELARQAIVRMAREEEEEEKNKDK